MKGISQTPIGRFVDWDRRMKVPVQMIEARNQGHQCGLNDRPRRRNTPTAVSDLLQVTLWYNGRLHKVIDVTRSREERIRLLKMQNDSEKQI